MLNSTSSNEDVFAAYDDNASYEETGSITQAQAFISACRILLRRVPKRFLNDGQMAETNPDRIQKEMDQARRWVASMQGRGRGARYYDLGDSRD